jgi:hypothetical protein
MNGRMNGSGLGFVTGLWGKSGEVEASPKYFGESVGEDLSINRRATTDIGYKLLLRSIHTTRIMITTTATVHALVTSR